MESFHCFSSEPFSPDAAQSRASSGQTPVIPLPDPGEGGPVAPDIGGTPVIPLPNPGEGGPVAPGGGIGMVPGWPRWSSIRFLNADDAGTEVNSVGLVHDADDFARAEL